MNGTRSSAQVLVDKIVHGAGDVRAEIAICPPFVLIPAVADRLQGMTIAWGGQNLEVHPAGAFTGEISGSMLRDAGCTYVIVGHSERRALFREDDAVVAGKFGAAQTAGLIPILCVGETLAEREAGATEAVVERQLRAVLEPHGIQALARAVIAYEPVWAIGTGRTASPAQAQKVHAFIRGLLAARDAGVAAGVRIIYGGSVKDTNARELFAQSDIDGGLIGGASLHADEFLNICRAAGG